MPAPEYRFRTEWRVAGTVEEVARVLSDVRELGRWWPAVYLKVDELSAGDENGVGKRARLHTKGWLPYTLDWELKVVESRHPRGFTIEAQGDLAGRGVWSLEPAGAWTRVTYDWVVRAEKPLLRALSPLFRPVLAANHRWAMRKGEESLVLELARRRASTPAERARIPAPPQPAGSPVLVIGAGAALGLAVYGLACLVFSRRRRR
ncbi:MAG TPA: SRPBCC family protein [Thermoanaerobaculia bacterium]|nr:SRPBCC family protein [Thermoanaerobaculia bacterium]